MRFRIAEEQRWSFPIERMCHVMIVSLLELRAHRSCALAQALGSDRGPVSDQILPGCYRPASG